METTNRLTRSRTDRVIAGVCGGLAQYFGVDPLIVRAIFVLLIFFPFPSVLPYLILWVIMPLEGSQAPTQEVIRQNLNELKGQAERVLERTGLRRSQQLPAEWRYDPYTGQPINQQQQQQQQERGGQQ